MHMKKRLILPVFLGAALVLFGCEPTESSSTGSLPSSSEAVITVESVSIVDYVSGDPIDVLDISLTTPGDVRAVVNPSTAPQTVTWSIGDPSIISFNEATGVVTGLALGSTTLTATAGSLGSEASAVSDTITVNVNQWTMMDIDDFDSGENSMVYGFRGILEDLDHDDQYGNCYVTDPETGASVQIYGATTTASALTINEDGTGSFSNPKDAATTLAAYDNGDWVTGYGVWTANYSNLSAVFLSHADSTETYTASAASWSDGTITLSKTEGLAYGETVTVTVTPNASVTNDIAVWVDTAYGQAAVNGTGTANTYTFTATCSNEVHARVIDTTETAIADIVANGKADNIYYFRGILEDLDHTDRYGNCYITDPATGATMTVYGATTTTTAISYTGETTASYSNPRDAVTTLAEYENGELVTGYGVWSTTHNNISAVLTSHAASTSTYSVTVDTFAHGSATATPNTGVSYGDTVTVTVTPDAGYSVISVTVVNAQGSAVTCTEGATAGTYTFSATCVNRVVVVCDQASSGEQTIDLSEDSAAIAAFSPTLGTRYDEASATVAPFALSTNRGGLNTPNSGGANVWPEKYFCLAGNASNESTATAYLDITVPSSMSITDVEVTYHSWANRTATTVDLSYLNGSAYTSLLAAPVDITDMEYADAQTLAPAAGTTFSTTTVRISITTTYSGNQRVGIASVTLTIA